MYQWKVSSQLCTRIHAGNHWGGFADTPRWEQGALPAGAIAAHALTPAAGRAPAHPLPGVPAPLQLPVKFLPFSPALFSSLTRTKIYY